MNRELSNEGRPIMIGEGLFVVPSSPSEEPHLLGRKCRNCGEVFFPPRRCCRRCSSQDMEELVLSRIGKLYSFTVVRKTPPGSLTKAPYFVGTVELPEGERINTLLTNCDPDNPDSLKIGDEMELVVDVIGKDEVSGQEVLGWKFRPSGASK